MDVSIIIPCYNSGKYLPDAIKSIETYSNKSRYEVIIVNDGSTDQDTLTLLSVLQAKGYTVIHQENKGPAAARNAGVISAKGKYLLFLDSDNKIRNVLLDKGLELLSAHQHIGIVYGNAAFFGDSLESQFNPQDFNMFKLLEGNYIDMCSLMRKKVWEDTGGFDEERILIGHEDWEFWIRAGLTEWKFYYINEIVFDYRIRQDSVIKQASQPLRKQQMLRYVYAKHLDLFLLSYKSLYRQFTSYKHDQELPFRSFVKYFINKYVLKKRSYKI